MTNHNIHQEEIVLTPKSGMAVLLLNTLAMLVMGAIIGVCAVLLYNGNMPVWLAVTAFVVAGLYLLLIGPTLYAGLKVLKPNEALVLVLFGKYIGSIKSGGFFFVNPFVTTINPARGTNIQTLEQTPVDTVQKSINSLQSLMPNNKISLKVLTFSNDTQKINDALGTPVTIGIVLNWRVINTAKAVFNVDNYKEYLAVQCNSALRDITQRYPYDAQGNESEQSLRGSCQEIAQKLQAEIQEKVGLAGLEIIEARITHLSYAPEIAPVMLQRQQATAVIDAKQMIVDASVSIVEMALKKLSETELVHLDEERKAAMVSNLLVVLCGTKEAQPIVNSGSIY
ncbi:MAG: SPFH domain-containing protein [Oscillospiraceae bacterium]|nr:SPFH domain-containing protein [Oscillospiraceae bacterium]